MMYLLIPLAAFLASALTLFSGFGLGTLLMPVFAVFFPLDVAVSLTAIVHLLNNLFKLVLLGRHADKDVALRFGVPAVLAALAGAQALVWLADLPALARYHAFGRDLAVTPVNLAVALLMVFFALMEAAPGLAKLSFDRKYLSLGGLLSGFFGGLSGHQGALRSAFLIRSGLGKESFIATGVVIACLVDVTRLFVYAAHFSAAGLRAHGGLLAAATLTAFLGAWLGNRLMRKVTLRAVQRIVAALLFVIAAALGAGFI